MRAARWLLVTVLGLGFYVCAPAAGGEDASAYLQASVPPMLRAEGDEQSALALQATKSLLKARAACETEKNAQLRPIVNACLYWCRSVMQPADAKAMEVLAGKETYKAIMTEYSTLLTNVECQALMRATEAVTADLPHGHFLAALTYLDIANRAKSDAWSKAAKAKSDASMGKVVIPTEDPLSRPPVTPPGLKTPVEDTHASTPKAPAPKRWPGPAFTSPAALKATDTYHRTLASAKQDADKALAAAKKLYLDALENQFKDRVAAGDLKTAGVITRERKALEPATGDDLQSTAAFQDDGLTALQKTFNEAVQKARTRRDSTVDNARNAYAAALGKALAALPADTGPEADRIRQQLASLKPKDTPSQAKATKEKDKPAEKEKETVEAEWSWMDDDMAQSFATAFETIGETQFEVRNGLRPNDLNKLFGLRTKRAFGDFKLEISGATGVRQTDFILTMGKETLFSTRIPRRTPKWELEVRRKGKKLRISFLGKKHKQTIPDDAYGPIQLTMKRTKIDSNTIEAKSLETGDLAGMGLKVSRENPNTIREIELVGWSYSP